MLILSTILSEVYEKGQVKVFGQIEKGLKKSVKILTKKLRKNWYGEL